MDNKLTANELRQKFIDFFTSKGHRQISGASLIPENDPTVLFTTAGMHPLVPYILGEEHPAGNMLCDYQKCIRTGDIDSVGDPHHLTFFEMLGNWSLGAYFKKEAIGYSFEFLTKVLNIDVNKLSVTVFRGDDEVARDDEAAETWMKYGIPRERIYFLPREDNWWGPAGETGPCGPDSEMFIDTGRPACGPDCKPGCKCGKYFEIWNDVFMGYQKTAEGKFVEMDRKCVDTGMGIERTIAILQGKKSVYETEVFQPIIRGIEKIAGVKYGDNEDVDTSIRILADHIRTSVFILGDQKGLAPSNVGQGYILRRLIRRAVRHGMKLGIQGSGYLADLAKIVFDLYGEPYPEIIQNRDFVLDELMKEAEKFSATLLKGEKEFEKMLPNLLKGKNRIVPGRTAFKLYDTYGFPIELTVELAAEHGFTVDEEGFKKAFEKHQELSRGAGGQFKGGLADHSEATTALHTATHLLHQALCDVYGGYVKQLGSNITVERLRFDFNHPCPCTKEELQKIEDIVNSKIEAGLPVVCRTMSLDEAKELGAAAQFDAKYGEQVKVYSIGDYSTEVCGGPHVENTKDMGHFRIIKEQSSSAGVRRIKAVLEK